MRKICVITGTRAEYGLLRWVMQCIKDDSELTLQIIATGMHLSPEFGLTYKMIEQNGFQIDRKVEMLTSSDTPVGIAKSIGLGLIGFGVMTQNYIISGIGAIPLLTGTIGFCPLYPIFKLNTGCKRAN